MDNQHRLISGYRELSPEEIALMNEIKAVGEALGTLHDSIRARLNAQYRALDQGSPDDSEFGPIDDAVQAIANAKQHLQTGIMWLTRAVAQPKGF